MKVYPIQGAAADQKHWIVRSLRFTGYLELIGGIGSLAVGLAITMPIWALSMVLDDLHALRVYHQGFAVTDTRDS